MKIGNRTFEGWVQAEQCLACGSNSPPTQAGQELDLVTIVDFGGASLPLYTPIVYLLCGECGVEYQAWSLNDEALNLYYKHDVYRQFIDRDNKERRDFNAGRWVKPMLGILEGEGIKPLRQLDFGCAQGTFLRNVPWPGVGVEISDGAREHANSRGAEVYSSLEEVEGLFDLVTIIETLEHLSRPRDMLLDLADKMIDDGIMVISVPWNGLHTGAKSLHHLTAFTAEALVNLTESVGLRTRQVMRLVVAEESGGDRNATRLLYIGEKA